MNDNEFIMPPDFVPASIEKKRRFPAVVQLSILAAILLVIFISLLIPQLRKDKPSTVANYTATTTVPTEEVSIISTIKPPALTAAAVYVYDVKAKRSLYQKNADEVLPLASITKLMTTLVASELMSGERTITVPAAAAKQQSSSGLTAGEKLSHDSLSQFALMASSNDAAYSLAAAAGSLLTDNGNNLSTFVEAMNITAEELGLNTLRFYNATGLDRSATEAGAYGSARDVSFLLEHILLNNPSLLTPTTESSELVYNTAGAYHEAENTNPLINRIPNLLASKTGYTDLAGGNLTIAFDAGFNRPIIITVLGSGYDERFNDVAALVAAVESAFAEANQE